jgi:hypothetical protein
MTNLQKGLQRELCLFKEAIEQDGGSIPEVDKSAFCKARKHLKHSAFSALSDIVTTEFYKSDEVQTWKGFRVLGVDGSTAELPNSENIKSKYGVFKTRKDGKTTSMARMLVVYDTINQMTLHGAMGHIENESESSMLWDCLPGLQLNPNDILVFDRYYASHILFFYLQKRGVQFCFRMKKNWWKEVERFYNSGEDSSVISLKLPTQDRVKAKELGITATKIKCRLTKIELESGEIEILLTSLVNEDIYSVEDTKQLYGLRWPIEESYKSFKHKVCIENFSGKTQKNVLQDFYVKIFIMNLTAVAVRPINDALKKKAIKVKFKHQVNFIEAIFTTKRAVVSFFVTNQVGKGIKRLIERISNITEPIRPNRKYKRTKQPKRKYYMNYKPV